MTNGKYNVLFWGDNPAGITGFGKVIKNVIREVYDSEKFIIDVLAIGYLGDPRPIDTYNGVEVKYDLYSPFEMGRQIDMYGGGKLLSMLNSGRCDILFILQDTFILRTVIDQIIKVRESLREQGKNEFVIVYYYPIDNAKVPKDWINNVVSKVDIPVTYTNFAKKVSLENDPELKDIEVIYHGTDKELFQPYPQNIVESMRKTFWGQGYGERFIILNVNRNQPRKDLHRTFAVYSLVKKLFKDEPRQPYLYILANPGDIGGNIIEVASQYGLVWGKDWFSPDPARYNPMLGIDEKQVSMIYNLSDVVISTALGEGWGLSLTEAMASGIPVIFPDHTSISEIIGEGNARGVLVPAGVHENNICLGPPDNNLVRPLVDTKAMADAIFDCYKDYDKYKRTAETSVDWVPSWKQVGQKWKQIFQKAIELKENHI